MNIKPEFHHVVLTKEAAGTECVGQAGLPAPARI